MISTESQADKISTKKDKWYIYIADGDLSAAVATEGFWSFDEPNTDPSECSCNDILSFQQVQSVQHASYMHTGWSV